MGIITPRSTRAAREVIQVDYAHSCCIFLSINDLPRLFVSLSLSVNCQQCATHVGYVMFHNKPKRGQTTSEALLNFNFDFDFSNI